MNVDYNGTTIYWKTDIDISQPIPVDTDHIKLYMSLSSSYVNSILIGSLTNTNNEGLYSYSDYTPETNLAISFYQSALSANTNTVVDTEIPHDITNTNYTKFLCSQLVEDGGNTHIKIFLIESYNTSTIDKSARVDFDYNTSYKIAIDFDKIFV